MATLQELAELVGEDVEEDADTLDLEDKELSEVPAAVCGLEAVEEVCASKTEKSIRNLSFLFAHSKIIEGIL